MPTLDANTINRKLKTQPVYKLLVKRTFHSRANILVSFCILFLSFIPGSTILASFRRPCHRSLTKNWYADRGFFGLWAGRELGLLRRGGDAPFFPVFLRFLESSIGAGLMTLNSTRGGGPSMSSGDMRPGLRSFEPSPAVQTTFINGVDDRDAESQSLSSIGVCARGV